MYIEKSLRKKVTSARKNGESTRQARLALQDAERKQRRLIIPVNAPTNTKTESDKILDVENLPEF